MSATDAAVAWPTTLAAKAARTPGEISVYVDRSAPLIGRIAPGMVDQPQRKRVLLYGGWDIDTGVQADTWEWDGYGWINRVPTNDPGPRFAPGSTFDEVGQRVLLYGGLGSFAPTVRGADNDTWEWNGTNWNRIITPHDPGARAAPAMAYDPNQRRVLLFGGFVPPAAGSNTAAPDDALWSFDGRDWTQVPHTEPWPPPRGLGAMAVDRRTGNLVLHGGLDRITITAGSLDFLAGTTYLPDTWEWDGAVWRKLAATVAGLGVPTVTSDPLTGDLTLFVDGLQTSALYKLTDEAWVPLFSRAPARVFSQASWSSANQQMVVTGGVSVVGGRQDSSADASDWLVGTHDDWSKLPDASAPTPRDYAVAAVVRATGHALLSGGIAGDKSYVADNWIWNGGRWSLVPVAAPAPTTRAAQSMASLGDDSILLFGGSSPPTVSSDTWIWREAGNSWTEVAGLAPSARINGAMCDLGDAVVLFGGDVGSVATIRNDTWMFHRASGWTQVVTPVTPPARTQAALTPALDGKSVILFGGYSLASEPLSDEWSFDGTSWTQLADLAPLTRRRMPIVADVALGRQYLLSGLDGALLSDSWDFSALGVTFLDVRTIEDHQRLPVRRNGHTAFPNRLTGGVVMVGGISNQNDQPLPDTWQLKTFGSTCTQTSECSAGQACTDGVCCEASTCGPCRTCASPDSPGLCAPRGKFGPEPGCDQPGQSCNVQGLCRLDNEQTCDQNVQCASSTCLTAGREAGICCAAEGCTVRCVEGGLQGPDGTTASCAPYTCEGNRCKPSCKSIEDCAGGFVCDEQGACVPPASTDSSGGCSCHADGDSAPSFALLGIVLAGLALLRREK